VVGWPVRATTANAANPAFVWRGSRLASGRASGRSLRGRLQRGRGAARRGGKVSGDRGGHGRDGNAFMMDCGCAVGGGSRGDGQRVAEAADGAGVGAVLARVVVQNSYHKCKQQHGSGQHSKCPQQRVQSVSSRRHAPCPLRQEDGRSPDTRQARGLRRAQPGTGATGAGAAHQLRLQGIHGEVRRVRCRPAPNRDPEAGRPGMNQ
jgi:hypothetical protein